MTHDVIFDVDRFLRPYITDCPHKQINTFTNQIIKVGGADCERCTFCRRINKDNRIVKCTYGEIKQS